MAVKNLYGLSGQLAVAINSLAAVIRVDPTLAGAIAASGFVNGVDSTYFAITANNVYEVVKVTGVTGQDLSVVRGVESDPQAFPVGSRLNFVVTAAGVLETIGPINSTVQLAGTGLAEVTNPSGDNWNINVDVPVFTGTGGISVLGEYPNMTFTYTPQDCCGDDVGGSGDGITSLTGVGIATAYNTGAAGYVNVAAPVFTGSGVTITGTWPNYTFTVTATGAGTVTSVAAGAGITVTGAPTVTPTVGITNTGVVAGTYGGVVINARGQITTIPAAFNPVSIVNVTAPLTVSRPSSAETITLAINTAGIDTLGAVALVDHTDPFDPTNTTQAMTPAAVATAMATLGSASAAGNNSYSGEAAVSYTNAIGGSATAISLLSGEKAIVYAEVTVLDGAAPLTPVDYGIAVFNAGGTMIKGNRIMEQSQQVISFLIDGPVSATTFGISTTALPGGSSLISYSMYIQKL
jgi:hypothetical protein